MRIRTGLFTSPQFFLEMAFLGLLFLGAARAKRTARSIPTRLGRLGLVLHWAALAVAAVLLGTAGLIATQAKQLDDGPVYGAAALGVLALVIWLVGKALRYILTGPTEPIEPVCRSRSLQRLRRGQSRPARGNSREPRGPRYPSGMAGAT